MHSLEAEILNRMSSQAQSIRDQAVDLGYRGDLNDAEAVRDFLLAAAVTPADFGRLAANSAGLEMGQFLLDRCKPSLSSKGLEHSDFAVVR